MSRKHTHPIARTLSAFTEFPLEAVCTLPVVSLRGSTEAEITYCRGILEYDEGKVVLATAEDTITVRGEGLILSDFHEGTLRIRGRIYALTLEQEGGERDV